MDTSAITGAGPASASASRSNAQPQNPGPASSLSPTSPVSVRSQGFGINGGAKRKRSSDGVMVDSPGSIDGDDDGTGDHNEKKRQPGVKRACNECRQQKVRLTSSRHLREIADQGQSLPLPNSCAAMSYRNPSQVARDVSASSSSVKSNPTSSAWASDRNMPRWRKR